MREESTALKSILGPGSTEAFFDRIWQKSCALYTNTEISPGISTENFDEEEAKASPHQALVQNGWSSLLNLLETARKMRFTPDADPDTTPLLFQKQQSVPATKYSRNLFHAYLGGCSIVLNHADQLCPYLATLCLDLQKSFPHAYCNIYLTPPHSQAVQPHADDRDVLVIQVYGEKEWTVYKEIPIPYPYPHEQVGKELPVPPHILEGDILVQRTLRPGDVLYMPRGYVHKATTSSVHPSFHATVALATHDWTLCGLLTNATQHTLSRVIDYRMALPYRQGEVIPQELTALQTELDNIWTMLRNNITADAVVNNLAHRYQRHNQLSQPGRQAIIESSRDVPMTTSNATVGEDAAVQVQLDSRIRAATSEEKALVIVAVESERGLHVRDETADAIMSLLSEIKQHPEQTFRVSDLKAHLSEEQDATLVCDLTLLSFVKVCVELGAVAIVKNSS
jgi:hypothetical protein